MQVNNGCIGIVNVVGVENARTTGHLTVARYPSYCATKHVRSMEFRRPPIADKSKSDRDGGGFRMEIVRVDHWSPGGVLDI